jgi:uroporphyrinogen decarboxylase
MRQAGRFMGEYRKIRQQHSLHEMFRTPEIAAAVTLQPIEAFELDAAIIFSDILLPLEGMGIQLEFAEKEGPRIDNPVRNMEDIRALKTPNPEESLDYVLSAIRLVRREIDGKVPLIGFAGGPFTLAGYAIEGAARNFLHTKEMMYAAPELWHRLMEKLSGVIAEFLLAQAKAGAQVLQLFDSWVGCLSPADYQDFVLPHSRGILQKIKQAGIPAIHFGTSTADLLPLMREAGGDVIGVDWRTHLDDAWLRIGVESGIQGNLDPVTLMAPQQVMLERARAVLDRAAGRPGHIFNLGHGVLPPTPEDSVRMLVDYVHQYRGSRQSGALKAPRINTD